MSKRSCGVDQGRYDLFEPKLSLGALDVVRGRLLTNIYLLIAVDAREYVVKVLRTSLKQRRRYESVSLAVRETDEFDPAWHIAICGAAGTLWTAARPWVTRETIPGPRTDAANPYKSEPDEWCQADLYSLHYSQTVAVATIIPHLTRANPNRNFFQFLLRVISVIPRKALVYRKNVCNRSSNKPVTIALIAQF